MGGIWLKTAPDVKLTIRIKDNTLVYLNGPNVFSLTILEALPDTFLSWKVLPQRSGLNTWTIWDRMPTRFTNPPDCTSRESVHQTSFNSVLSRLVRYVGLSRTQWRLSVCVDCYRYFFQNGICACAQKQDKIVIHFHEGERFLRHLTKQCLFKPYSHFLKMPGMLQHRNPSFILATLNTWA